jgi:outer membrane receptor for ferrienterochelin and colicins
MSMGDEVQLSRRVAASGSLRLDYQMGFAARVTPRASLVIGPFRRTHFKALFGDALRVPSTNERFYGSSLSLQANPLLQPETIRSFEGVIEHRLDTTLSLSASAYRTDLNNLIVPVTLESGIVQLANSGVAVEGVELAAQASVHGFSGSGSYSFLRPRDAGSGYLDAAPRNLAKLRAMAPLGAHLTGALQMLWSGGVQAHNGERIDSALISNVTVTTRSLWQRVTLGASVYNLFDRKASYPVSEEHVQGSVPQYGRRFLTRLTWHF